MTVVLATLTMIGPFTIDTVFPGFVQIGSDLDAGEAAMQQVTSVYLLSFALMSVLHGPISDAAGRRTVMLTGLTGYVVASLVCALAPSLPVLLAGRAAQGLFAGAATIVSRAVVRDLYSGEQAQRLMSQIMMIFSIAPAVAPVIGGWLLQAGRWPVIFWFVAGYGVLAALLTVLVIPETLPREERVPLRLGAVAGGLWEVARSGPFERLALATALLFGGYFVYVVAAPIIVVDLLGKGEGDFWMLFVPQISGMALGAWVAGRVAGRVDPGRTVDRAVLGLIAAAVANVALCVVAPGLPWAVVGPALMGLAIGIAFPVLQLAMLDLFPHHRGSAASMASFASLLFNAALAGLVVPLVTATLVTTAVTSLTLVLLGAALWWWHRRVQRGA